MDTPLISLFVAHDAPDGDLEFARQIGADRVYTWVPIDRIDRESIASIRARVEDHGLELYNVGCIALGKNHAIHLGLPEREEAVERFGEFVTNLGLERIGVTTFTWEPDQVWSSSPSASRGARSRSVQLSELTARQITHGRQYEREELWDNFAWFIDRMTPALKHAGVRLALHPNDPPSAEPLGGVPCLINGIDEYARAFEHAPPDILGMEFCCGCWLEGRDTFGDPAASIRRFCREGRVLIVHFRNVSASLPNFTETFLDNGYGDMYSILKALVEEGYGGTITPDHVPQLAEPYGRGASMAYAVGYMRALIERWIADVEATAGTARASS